MILFPELPASANTFADYYDGTNNFGTKFGANHTTAQPVAEYDPHLVPDARTDDVWPRDV